MYFVKYFITKGCHRNIAPLIVNLLPSIWQFVTINSKNKDLDKIFSKLVQKKQTLFMIELVKSGLLEIFIYLKTKNVEFNWDPDICGWAAQNGHFEVLQWLINECSWNYKTCAAAA